MEYAKHEVQLLNIVLDTCTIVRKETVLQEYEKLLMIVIYTENLYARKYFPNDFIVL